MYNRIKIEETASNTWKLNRAAALKGFDLNAAKLEIAVRVADFITNEMKARGIAADDDGEKFVPMMRELGGFAKVIAEFLPKEVAATESGHGIPTNPEWFRREAIADASGDINNLTKSILMERFGE